MFSGGTAVANYSHSDADGWFAIRVNAKCERKVNDSLEGKGFESYFPRYWQHRNWGQRERKVERALFPGYVFGRFVPHNRLPILTIPGVAYIVGTSAGPAPVDMDELAAVRRITESSAMAEPYPYLEEGSIVSLDGGPLRGLRGRLVSDDRDLRVIVSITLLQRSVSVLVDRRWVRPIGEREWDCRALAAG
jgi:transcriptional antiterminator NusG